MNKCLLVGWLNPYFIYTNYSAVNNIKALMKVKKKQTKTFLVQ